LEDGKCGVNYNLISLFADVQVEEGVGFVIDILGEQVLYKLNPTSAIYIDAVGQEGLALSIRNINKSTPTVSSQKQWSYHRILEKVKATCFSPDRTESPNFNLGAKKVAAHFQVKFLLNSFVTFKSHKNCY